MTEFLVIGSVCTVWLVLLAARALNIWKVPKKFFMWTMPGFIFLASLILYSQISLGQRAVFLGCVGLSWAQCRTLVGPPVLDIPAYPTTLPDWEYGGTVYLYKTSGRVVHHYFAVIVDPETNRVRSVVEISGQ